MVQRYRLPQPKGNRKNDNYFNLERIVYQPYSLMTRAFIPDDTKEVNNTHLQIEATHLQVESLHF